MKFREYESKKAIDRFIKRLEREGRDYGYAKFPDPDRENHYYYIIKYEESKRTTYIKVGNEKVNIRKVFKKNEKGS